MRFNWSGSMGLNLLFYRLNAKNNRQNAENQLFMAK
jgi:hypothetical protein